jgi:hypothetical protein
MGCVRTEECMRTGQPLCLYANPLRLLFLFLFCAAFAVGGLFMVRDPAGVPCGAVGSWLCLVFFGFATVIVFLQLVRDGILRRPVLRIDEQGWYSRPTLFMGKRTAYWQDIAHVGLYRQFLGQHAIPRTTSYAYYLVVHAKDPGKAARVSLGPFATRFYPSLRGALIAVQLNPLFLRTTPNKVEKVLQQILSTYDFEIGLYGIQTGTTVQNL